MTFNRYELVNKLGKRLRKKFPTQPISELLGSILLRMEDELSEDELDQLALKVIATKNY
jgi:hypothetical protein